MRGTLMTAFAIACSTIGCGGGGGAGSDSSGATASIQILDPTGNPCSGLTFTYTDPAGEQHTEVANASGKVTVSLAEAGSYYLNSLQYGAYHHGPGSMLLGSIGSSDALSDVVLDFFVVYSLTADTIQVIGPVSEGAGGILASASVLGDWTLDFQWSGRSPGVIRLTCQSNGTFVVPAGQPGIGSGDSYGTWTLDNGGNEITFVLADHQVWVGKVLANSDVTGAMVDTNGIIGSFTGSKD